MLTREEEILKTQALDIVSDLTSARNPDRIGFYNEIIKNYTSKYEEIQQKQVILSKVK